MSLDAVYRALAADPAAGAVRDALERAGARVYAVGGAVRDALLGVEPKDVDLLAAGVTPDDVTRALGALPGRVDYVGVSFGVFRYRHRGHEVEVALPRTERSSGAGHRDFDVTVDPELGVEDDLARRDFTANALALDLASGELVDPFGGAADIERRVLHVVSPQSFQDDPLRMVRALVAYARHGLVPDADTRGRMAAEAARIRHLPGERLFMELRKLFAAPAPADAVALAHETGVLAHVLPEVDVCFGYDQRSVYHELDLGGHLLAVLERLSLLSTDPDLRLTALLHDVGKPASQWLDDEGVAHYYLDPDRPGTLDHAEVGARLARAALRRLRYPEGAVERVTRLVRLHMFPRFETPRGARRFLQRAGGPDTARDLLRLREADRAGRHGGEQVALMWELLERELERGSPYSVRQLTIDGSDLISLGIPEGPEIGRILRDLLERVVDEPELNERDGLLRLATDL